MRRKMPGAQNEERSAWTQFQKRVRAYQAARGEVQLPFNMTMHARMHPMLAPVHSMLAPVHSMLVRMHSMLVRMHSMLVRMHSMLVRMHSMLSQVHSMLSQVHSMLSQVHSMLSPVHSPLGEVHSSRVRRGLACHAREAAKHGLRARKERFKTGVSTGGAGVASQTPTNSSTLFKLSLSAQRRVF